MEMRPHTHRVPRAWPPLWACVPPLCACCCHENTRTRLARLLPVCSSLAPLGRSGKQARERYQNHLAPGVLITSIAPWTDAEDSLIYQCVASLGTRWAEVAHHLPGRTENQLKNRFWSASRRAGNAARGGGRPAGANRLVQLLIESPLPRGDSVQGIGSEAPAASLPSTVAEEAGAAFEATFPDADDAAVSSSHGNAPSSSHGARCIDFLADAAALAAAEVQTFQTLSTVSASLMPRGLSAGSAWPSVHMARAIPALDQLADETNVESAAAIAGGSLGWGAFDAHAVSSPLQQESREVGPLLLLLPVMEPLLLLGGSAPRPAPEFCSLLSPPRLSSPAILSLSTSCADPQGWMCASVWGTQPQRPLAGWAPQELPSPRGCGSAADRLLQMRQALREASQPSRGVQEGGPPGGPRRLPRAL